MRVKYIVHRSKGPFARQKEVFRKIVKFYGEKYTGLRFIDKGLRFSAIYKDLTVDFDFGYLNMRYRDFSAYNRVIAHSNFTVLNPSLSPGDLAFPVESDLMRINGANTKVRVYAQPSLFQNRMNDLWDDLQQFERKGNPNKVHQFVSGDLSPDSQNGPGTFADFNVKKKAHFVESNAFFRPSRLKDANAVLRVGEERHPIRDLQAHLEGRFDGVNCEAKQMIENLGDQMVMFGVALDKPYHGAEPEVTSRFGSDLERVVPEYNDARINYFLTQFFGYCLDKQFRI